MDQHNLHFEQSFTNHAHSGSIRAVAASSELIASGGTDEVVRIFSGKKRTDVGTLVQQQGTISCIDFFQDSHMFTGSEDGTICVGDTRNWECLKTLRGHKTAVLDISIHPSGKMLLSVSRDRTLRTWNLIKGRCAYITNLKTVAHSVFWSPNGRDFVVAVDDRLDVYNIAVGAVVSSFRFGKRISSVAFLTVSPADIRTPVLLTFMSQETAIVVGGDSEYLEIRDLSQQRSLIRFRAHDNRVKSLFSTYARVPEAGLTWLFSVSSDCHIKLWEVSQVVHPTS